MNTEQKQALSTQISDAINDLKSYAAESFSNEQDFTDVMWRLKVYQIALDTLTAQDELVPDGWKLVPVEPTEEMIIDGFESRPDESFSEPAVWKKYSQMSGCQQAAYKAQLCWAAMLAAAPEVE